MTRERNRYFVGRLLGAEDFEQEQHYLLEKARRHNRLLHGWGIVCGLLVRPGPAESEVTVEPGYALDPRGDEILVEDEVTVDLCERTERPLYLAIRYAECATHPIPGGESVEYSRVRETFVIDIVTELPGEPWVVLAEVLLDSSLGVSSIDCHTHARRISPPEP